MPKIKEPKHTNRKDERAIVHWKGTMYPMGKSGTQEAKIAYHRFCIEVKSNPNGFVVPHESADTTMGELVAAYLDHSKKYHKHANYVHYMIALMDYLLNCFGEDTLVDAFSPKTSVSCIPRRNPLNCSQLSPFSQKSNRITD